MSAKEKKAPVVRNSLTDAEKVYIRKHHKKTSVPAMAKHLVRVPILLYRMMDAEGLVAYNPSQRGRKRRVMIGDGYFKEHQHENWIV